MHSFVNAIKEKNTINIRKNEVSKQTIKGWLLDNYELQTIKEITEHGCISGICPDLIYYNDTENFHDLHQEEIWNLLEEDRDNQGMDTILDLIASFNGAKDVGSMMQFKNLLTWYAIERIAYDIINTNEGN